MLTATRQSATTTIIDDTRQFCDKKSCLDRFRNKIGDLEENQRLLQSARTELVALPMEGWFDANSSLNQAADLKC